MGNQKKDVRELLLAINSVSYPTGLEFKVIYEYRFKPNIMAITTDRKVIVFNGKMPIFQFKPNDDMEIILFLIEQMKKIENGEEIKFKKKRKKGRESKNKLNQEELENGKDCNYIK